MCSLNPVNTPKDIDQTVAQLRQPETVLFFRGEEPTSRDRVRADAVRGQVEYARMKSAPGAIIHPDGVIEIPE